MAYVELLLRAAFVRAATDDDCAEFGPLPGLVSYLGRKRRSFSAWIALPKYYRYRRLATVNDLSRA